MIVIAFESSVDSSVLSLFIDNMQILFDLKKQAMYKPAAFPLISYVTLVVSPEPPTSSEYLTVLVDNSSPTTLASAATPSCVSVVSVGGG